MPKVTLLELETLRAINLPLGQPTDDKIVLALIPKGLVKIAVHGYALTGKGMSVLAANG